MGIFTLLAAIYTAKKTSQTTREIEIESYLKKPRIEIYEKFLSDLYDMFNTTDKMKDTEQILTLIQEWQQKTLFWGGPQVILSYIKWRQHIHSVPVMDAESILLIGDLVLATRKDLGLSNYGINRNAFVFLLLDDPSLFFENYEKNRNVNLLEIYGQS